jgi:hypothetical protein
VPQFRGDHQLLTGAMDRAAEHVLLVDGESHPLQTVSVPESLCEDYVRTVAASHLQNLNGQFKTDWAVTHQLVTDDTALLAIAEHEVDQKVIGKAITVKVQQQMANDWHGAEMHAVMHAVPQSMPRGVNQRLYSPPAMDVDYEDSDLGTVAYSPRMSAPDRMYADYLPRSAPAAARSEHRYAANVIQLLANQPDATLLTLADLLGAGFDSDLIDACRSIAGYTEQQIVLALCVLVLGKVQAKRFKLAVDTVPTALLGGLKIIVG